jgi:copper(I)-binding protein
MQSLKPFAALLLASSLALSTLPAWAQKVQVKNAWTRATVPGQKATGAFMQLTADQDSTLLRVEAQAAAVVEIHEMKMEGDIMKMRALPNGLALPAGKTVELKPGDYHVMLLDLKIPLRKDTAIPMTLVFQNAKGVQTKTTIQVPVQMTPPQAAAAHGAHMGH